MPPFSRLPAWLLFAATIISSLFIAATHAADPKVDPEVDPAREAFFESRIRPVLIKHCYECHSADSKELAGSLRVDSAAGLLAGGDSGPALKPGKPNDSVLLEALRYEGVEMPPKGKLPANVIADFEKWIRDGAYDPREGSAPQETKRTIDIEQGRLHWAYQPVRSPAANRNEPAAKLVDRLIAKRLQAANISPRGQATPAAFVRRIYFDLTGLPPTRLQWQKGVAKVRAGKASELVDQLLESKQFGVHWGRHWLDVARYADSNGGDFNATFHNAWRYRDYVVDAYNADKPFDQFVREQIAGDLLPGDSPQQQTEQVVATGFLMLGAKMLSERDKEKLTMDVVDEQINTVGAAFMGMTLGCARCHDHKFDPIPTRDYYAMAGIFLSTRTLQGESQKYVSTWPKVDLPPTQQLQAAHQSFQKQKQRLEGQLKKWEAEAASLRMQVKRDALVLDDTDAELKGVWKKSVYKKPFQGAGYQHDENIDKGKSATFTFQVTRPGDYEIQFGYVPHSSHAPNVPVQIEGGGETSSLRVDQTKTPDIDKAYVAIGRRMLAKDDTVVVTVQTNGTEKHVIIDAMRLVLLRAADSDGGDASESPEMVALRQQLLGAEKSRDAAKASLKKLKDAAPEPLPQALAVAENKTAADCEICIRGEHRNRGERVPRGFPQVMMPKEVTASLSPQPGASGRLQLAEWLVHPSHPLTARVYVNRIWRHLFGEGLVRSVDNFGKLGEPPSHPELLDTLAWRFMTPVSEGGWGWSTKSALRDLMATAAYQRSSEYDAGAWDQDPENRLLWRAHRRRLSAESIRDAMLLQAGSLELVSGGNPVPGLGVLVTNNSANAKQYTRTSSHYRSLYLPIIRNELPVELMAFDFADPDLVVGRRAVTNVPAQALYLLNSPDVLKAATEAASRIAEQAGYDPAAATSPGAKRSELAEKLVRIAIETTLHRESLPNERQAAAEFLLKGGADGDASMSRRLARYVQVLFASTEYRLLE